MFSVDSIQCFMTLGTWAPFRADRKGLMTFRYVPALLLLHVLLSLTVLMSIDLPDTIRIHGIYEESDRDDVAGVIVADTPATNDVSAFVRLVRPSFMVGLSRDAAGPRPVLARDSVRAPPCI